jgi:hypothetical protein
MYLSETSEEKGEGVAEVHSVVGYWLETLMVSRILTLV